MRRIVEYDHMADIDGNRGITAVFYELTAEDSPEIESQIFEFIQSTSELPDTNFTVYLIDPISEETIEFTINPFDFIPQSTCIEYLANSTEE